MTTVRRWYPGIEYEIDPDALNKDYTLQWAEYVPEGATISNATVAAADGLTVTAVTYEGTDVTAIVNGVAEGSRVPVKFRVTLSTVPALTDERTIWLCGAHQ
jgi:hypothetical protein